MYDFKEVLNYKLAFILKANGKLFSEELKEANITSLEYGCLVFINENPHITQIKLAHLFNIDRTTCGKVVNKLSDLGYISKTKSEKDKRAFTLHITDNGFDVVKCYWEKRKKNEDIILKGLTKDERETFNILLDKIIVDNKKEN